MIKTIRVVETLAGSELIQNMYDTEKLIKDVISIIEDNGVLNIEDYKFTNFVLEKTKVNLQKVKNILKVGE